MPKKPPTVCRSYGCGNATTSRNGYCHECQEVAKEKQSKRRGKKGSKFYWSTKWKKFRDWYKAKHPLCEDCLELDLIVNVDVVDHIVELKDGGKPYSEDNARSLCFKCHAKKTASEKKKRGGQVESPPTPPAQPFGSQKLPAAYLGGGGIERGGSNGKG